MRFQECGQDFLAECAVEEHRKYVAARAVLNAPRVPSGRTPSVRRSSQEITRLLVAWNRGEESALAELTPLVHGELRRLARSYLRRERGDHTLQTDALVNEAYLRLIDINRIEWRDRVHFLALSARLMRRILVDYARSKNYQKRGGALLRIPLDEGQHTRSSEARIWSRSTIARRACRCRREKGAGDRAAVLRRPERRRDGRDSAGVSADGHARLAARQGVAAAGAFRRQIMIPN